MLKIMFRSDFENDKNNFNLLVNQTEVGFFYPPIRLFQITRFNK